MNTQAPKRKRSSWFAFYPDDYAGGTRGMSLAAKGAFVDLLAYQFANGSIPSDDRTICRIVGAFPDEWQSIRSEVLAKFETEDDQLINSRMKKEREEREEIRSKRVEASKQGNQKRWDGNLKTVPNGIPNGIPNGSVLGIATTTTTTTLNKEAKASYARSDKSLQAATKPIWSKASGWQNITNEDRAKWSEAYPACDINRQLAAMSVWLEANPAKAKKSNWVSFITRWLSSSQDKGGDIRSGFTPNLVEKPKSTSLPDRWRIVATEELGRDCTEIEYDDLTYDEKHAVRKALRA